MTERSYFWNGTAKNDAIHAPYTGDEFTRLTTMLFATSGKYVLPPTPVTPSSFEVIGGSGQVTVSPGIAFIDGYYFHSTDNEVVPIYANNTVHPRWDRIVAQIDLETEEVAIIAVPGLPDVVPTLPEINDCDTLLQLPLARVWMPAGFSVAASSHIFDERVFAANARHQRFHSTRNHFPNHRFTAWGDSVHSIEKTGVVRQPLPGWYPYNNGSELISGELFKEQAWGRTALSRNRNTDAHSGWSFPINITHPNYAENIPITLRFMVQSKRGNVLISFAGETRVLYPTTHPQEFILRVMTKGNQTLIVRHSSGDGEFVFGDMRLSYGYVVADEFTNYPQFLTFPRANALQKPQTGTGTTYPLGVSGGNFNVDIPMYDFGTDDDNDEAVPDEFYVPKYGYGIQGHLLTVTAYDAGSAGAAGFANHIYFKTYRHKGVSYAVSYVYLAGEPSARPRYQQFIMHGQDGFYQDRINVLAVASAPGNLFVGLTQTGVII